MKPTLPSAPELTCNAAPTVAPVLMPTKPPEVIRSRSAPLVLAVMMLLPVAARPSVPPVAVNERLLALALLTVEVRTPPVAVNRSRTPRVLLTWVTPFSVALPPTVSAPSSVLAVRTRRSPSTSRTAEGTAPLKLPIPTLPSEAIRSRSVSLVRAVITLLPLAARRSVPPAAVSERPLALSLLTDGVCTPVEAVRSPATPTVLLNVAARLTRKKPEPLTWSASNVVAPTR